MLRPAIICLYSLWAFIPFNLGIIKFSKVSTPSAFVNFFDELLHLCVQEELSLVPQSLLHLIYCQNLVTIVVKENEGLL